MPLITKPISELLDFEFVIPNYQRGYRWDNDQVMELLEDLASFQNTAKDGSDSYCLQPVAVVPDADNDKRFIVVDGQQRLTTILLILKALEGINVKCYTLKMDQRKEQEDYIANGGYTSDTYDLSRNIDNFYVRQAYETITKWKEQNLTKARFLPTLLMPDPMKGHAAVIWYVLEDSDALEAFRRLNFGKIPLSAAELVKAILLQTDCYTDVERQLQVDKAHNRAKEWDDIERRLSDPNFEAMVSRREEKDAMRGIEIVLVFVADKLNKQLEKAVVRKEKRGDAPDYYPYHVIEQYIKENLEAKKSRKDIIDEVWREIQATYNILANWYDNRKWYHLIGLWRLLSSTPANKFMAEIYGLTSKDGKPVSKMQFENEVRNKIGQSIKVKEFFEEDGQKPADKQGLKSPELAYGKQDSVLRKILTAFNVMTVQNDPNGVERFPFHHFQKYNPTSLEHIHPQNIDTGLKYDQAVEWVKERRSDLVHADDKAWLKFATRVNLYTDGEELSEKETKEVIAQAKEHLGKVLAELDELMCTSASYDDNSEIIGKDMELLDQFYGDIAGISEGELHSIRNMALVTKKVNSSLGNGHLDVKRKKLLELDAAKKDKDGTYVPPCTHKVFAKQYRPENPGNMKFWQPEDRDAYECEIDKIYQYFIR